MSASVHDFQGRVRVRGVRGRHIHAVHVGRVRQRPAMSRGRETARDAPVRVASEHRAVLVEQARGHYDRARHLAQLRTHGLARERARPELRRRVRREHDVLAPRLAPRGVREVERGHGERRAARLERRVRAPHLDARLDGEVGRGERVWCTAVLLARHADGVGAQLALDRVERGLGPQEVVHDRPGCCRPAIVDLGRECPCGQVNNSSPTETRDERGKLS